MNTKAYLVAAIDKATGKITGAGIFSEPSPTISFKLYPVVLMESEGNTYAAARLGLSEHIVTGGQFDWLRRLVEVRL